MKRELRRQFFKILEAKHSLGIQKDPESGYDVLTEQDIFQVTKLISGVRIIPGSYQFVPPPSVPDTRQPWGPEIKFNFEYITSDTLTKLKGDPNIISKVENILTSKLNNLIASVLVTYKGDNIYNVVITQHPQK